MSSPITPELLLRAYAMGVFPMADSAGAQGLHWVEPRRRGVLPLEGFHISRSLAKEMRRGGFEIVANRDFAGVVQACADRPETWINGEIFDLYLALHDMGHAHSLELWEDGALRGGTYGVTLGRAFFAESMFSRRRSASKIVLAHLVERLLARGFVLLDSQFLTPHLASLGGIEISRAAYQVRLAEALQGSASFADQPSCGASAS